MARWPRPAGRVFTPSTRSPSVLALAAMGAGAGVTDAISTAAPPICDIAPAKTHLTGYDEQHLVTYLRLLDADEEGADWQEVAKIVLHIDSKWEPDRAKRAWESHLARAKWLVENGYRHLLRGGAPH